MPLPNEHSCRIRQPGDFQPDSFRRMVQGKLAMIVGRLKGESGTTVQTFRYPTDSWSEKEAREHCSAQGGHFEGAMTGAIREAAGRSRG
jgi:hypothetical protein